MLPKHINPSHSHGYIGEQPKRKSVKKLYVEDPRWLRYKEQREELFRKEKK